jgi:hypothetical protein
VRKCSDLPVVGASVLMFEGSCGTHNRLVKWDRVRALRNEGYNLGLLKWVQQESGLHRRSSSARCVPRHATRATHLRSHLQQGPSGVNGGKHLIFKIRTGCVHAYLGGHGPAGRRQGRAGRGRARGRGAVVCARFSNGKRGPDWLKRGKRSRAERSRRRECGVFRDRACCCDCTHIRSMPAPHGALKCSREVWRSALRYHRTPDERRRGVGTLHQKKSISPPMLLSHASMRGTRGSRLAWTVLRSMSAAARKKTSITTCAGGCMHLCARVCVYACVDQFRACVHVGTWVDAGLYVPRTVRSANNAIGTILKLDCFSGRTADLHVFLRSWCTLLAVEIAIVGRISV